MNRDGEINGTLLMAFPVGLSCTIKAHFYLSLYWFNSWFYKTLSALIHTVKAGMSQNLNNHIN